MTFPERRFPRHSQQSIGLPQDGQHQICPLDPLRDSTFNFALLTLTTPIITLPQLPHGDTGVVTEVLAEEFPPFRLTFPAPYPTGCGLTATGTPIPVFRYTATYLALPRGHDSRLLQLFHSSTPPCPISLQPLSI